MASGCLGVPPQLTPSPLRLHEGVSAVVRGWWVGVGDEIRTENEIGREREREDVPVQHSTNTFLAEKLDLCCLEASAKKILPHGVPFFIVASYQHVGITHTSKERTLAIQSPTIQLTCMVGKICPCCTLHHIMVTEEYKRCDVARWIPSWLKICLRRRSFVRYYTRTKRSRGAAHSKLFP